MRYFLQGHFLARTAGYAPFPARASLLYGHLRAGMQGQLGKQLCRQFNKPDPAQSGHAPLKYSE